MIVGSFTIRGLGGSINKRRDMDFIASNHLAFIAIQETKLEVVFLSLGKLPL